MHSAARFAKALCRGSGRFFDLRWTHSDLAALAAKYQKLTVDFDDQMRRYFGTPNLGEIPAETLEAGIEHNVDLGLTKDRNQRFALWALLHMLGGAPGLDVVFRDESDREAARNFMDLMQAASDEQSS